MHDILVLMLKVRFLLSQYSQLVRSILVFFSCIEVGCGNMFHFIDKSDILTTRYNTQRWELKIRFIPRYCRLELTVYC